MKILVKRFDSGSDDTLGEVFIDGKKECFSIEDEFRKIKVKGETRIPAGEYILRLRKEITPLTKKYRDKFNWFTWHIEVCNVPDFSYVYIHIGNTEKDTDACLILGKRIGSIDGKRAVLDSTSAYKAFYQKVVPILESGQEVTIKYMDL